MQEIASQAEKPIHVRVAKKLGWVVLEECVKGSEFCDGIWARAVNDSPYYAVGICPSCQRIEEEIPRYDTDWSALGPVIERLNIALWNQWALPTGMRANGGLWVATRAGDGRAVAETPLLAICNLLLVLPDEVVRA